MSLAQKVVCMVLFGYFISRAINAVLKLQKEELQTPLHLIYIPILSKLISSYSVLSQNLVILIYLVNVDTSSLK